MQTNIEVFDIPLWALDQARVAGQGRVPFAASRRSSAPDDFVHLSGAGPSGVVAGGSTYTEAFLGYTDPAK